MKIKLTLFAFLFVVVLQTLAAQNESDGFAKLKQRDYREAKQIFAAILKADPENAAALYGMGEYYYYTGKIDSAKICYQKGIDSSSSYACNYAGMGKLCLNSAPAEADAYFKDAVKKSKKEASAIVAIAKTYYAQTPRNFDEAKRYINLAIGVDPKNASAYFLSGLIELDKNNPSDASLQFDRAIYFDPNYLEAYLYQSDIMGRARSLTQAIEYNNKAIAVNSNYWPAYKKLGELYYDNQKYAEAVGSFATYFKNVTTDKDVTHYAYSLFFNKQYKEAREMIDKLVQQNPNDYVLLRLLGYISYETKDLVNGKSIMDKFFTLVPSEKILTDDYSYYGKMLSASGNDSLAIQNYNLALKKDSSQYQIFDELAKSSNKLKKYDEALQYSSKYFKKKPNLATSDYFLLGKAYYSTANNLNLKTDSLGYNVDSLKMRSYYHTADSLFTKVETYSPNSYLGTFWRARVNSAIDAETTLGLAKPFYEKTLESLIKDPVKYKKELSEIYSYLGFYYFQKEEKTTSVDFWKKLLEIDPENLKAQEAIKSLESNKQ
ncbi:MAG: tetratricopeptide repeat protein [Prolixibacteraceae bacterium]|nr:tetratricopeptide repeat protein [Prolixibacteraceae bacterium]